MCFSYQVQNDLFSIEDHLRVEVPLESVQLGQKSTAIRTSGQCRCLMLCEGLTWLPVLLICGFGLYLRSGLWDQNKGMEPRVCTQQASSSQSAPHEQGSSTSAASFYMSVYAH